VSTTINSGGIEDDRSVTSASRINSGGLQVVDPGGFASGALVMNGGMDVIVSGGTANGTTISGGFMEVRSGGSIGTVTFAQGGTMQLDDSIHFGGLVAGFGLPDMLDLRDIAFIAGTTRVNFVEAPSNTSGTLTVTDMTHTANMTLLGQYVAGNFHIQNDGAGGTLVTDPPVAATTDHNPIAPTILHSP